MSEGLEHCVAFSELYMIKFSIVYEGQETKKTQQNLEIATRLLCYRTAPCPILIQDKCDNDKKKEKGKPGLYFLVT